MSSKSSTTNSAPAVLSPEQAIEKYSAQVKTNATAANYLELGAAYYIAHRWQDAITAFEKTVELDSKQPYAYYYLGILYAALGQREKANAALEQLLQVSNNPMLKEQGRARIPKISSPADLGGK